MASQEFEEAIVLALDQRTPFLKNIGNDIWEYHELGFKEHKSSNLLANALEKEGFKVQKNVAGLDTAFKATFGSGSPHIAFLCEYDALPEIGHACGHNLIAEAGLAAGIGLKSAMVQASLPGTVSVFGTPAEEGGGGKVIMIEKGCFEGVDVAMMVHPTSYNDAVPTVLARRAIKIVYKGKESHAAMAPWEGVNALDAAVLAYTSISTLRQQMQPSWRVHGIITRGGVKPNIIPGMTEMHYYIRTPNEKDMEVLYKKCTNCFQSAAIATGCEVEIQKLAPSYSNMVTNMEMVSTFVKILKGLNISMDLQPTDHITGSTDMGNISHVVPSIHPMYSIGTAVNHTKEFAQLGNTPHSHQVTLLLGKAMALTGLSVLTDKKLLEKIKEEFKRQSIDSEY